MTKMKISEFSYDIHSAFGQYETPEFDYLKTLGMAATLAVHIRGLGEIKYSTLKMGSFHYFKIPSFAIERVIKILDELEFIDIVSKKNKIKSIIPKVPHFRSIYDLIDDYSNEDDLNECEQALLSILNNIYLKPENKQKLINSIDANMVSINTCLKYSEKCGLLRTHKARGKEIILSPYYFSDNLDGLADLTAKSGSNNIVNVLEKLKANQGWPLSMLLKNQEIGGRSLDDVELSLIKTMSSEGILKPPSIKFNKGNSEQFVFTPSPGSSRLNATNREIYERAMALVSCVRKGQLMPKEYKINSPIAILKALKNRGYLGSNSETSSQYKNLVYMKVATIIHVSGNKSQLWLIQSEENIQALDIAITLLETGDLANLEVNKEAKIAFSKDETYIQSIISASEMREIKQISTNEEANYEIEQLLLNLGL